MQKMYFLAVIAGFLYACGGASTSATETDAPESDQVAADEKLVLGYSTYKSYCVACHGAEGNLGVSGAKDLTASVLTLEERVEIITNGRGLMAAYKGILEENAIAAVAEYTLGLKK